MADARGDLAGASQVGLWQGDEARGQAPVAGGGRMTEAAKDVAKITDYHAHIYYDPADADSRARAAQLREWVEARFPVRMGRNAAPPHQARYRRGITTFASPVKPSVVPIRMNASAAANGQLLSPENAQYSSGAIIWNFGPPSSTGVANA